MRVKWCALFSVLIVVTGCARQPARPRLSDGDKRIQYYTKKVSQRPRHYPSYALLGAAYLDKARETLDPTWLREARSALNRSMQIQPNFEAIKRLAALCNFAHRFEDGLRWGKRAAETYPTDSEVTALLVESYVGLGKYDEARKLLSPASQKPTDFFTAVAWGNWQSSQRRFDEAARRFEQAADFARAENAKELIVWAEVSAAGAFMDGRQLERARPHLKSAARLDNKNLRLNLHRAEFFEAEGKFPDALAVYEALLKERDDPAIHHKAFSVARKLGQASPAQRHFAAAEKGFQRVIAAGEIYTLGALARLYCDADAHLERALALAQRNLQYKRDVEAQRTLADVRRKLDGKTQ